MSDSVIESKGRTVLPKDVRKALGVSAGDRIRYVILDNNEVRIIPVHSLSELFGSYQYGGPPATLEDMERAITEGASEN